MTEQIARKVPQIRFHGFFNEWKEEQLENKVEFFSGLTYSPSNVQKGVGTFVLRSSNVKNGEIIDADNVYVDSEIVNCKKVEVGDIAVVVRNGSRSLIGKHAQIKKEMVDTVIGAFMTGIKSQRPDFITALLDTAQFSSEIAKNLGATINQITTGAFREMCFNFTEDKEEIKIGTYFKNLDQVIELHQQKHKKLITLKKAMLQKMFPQNGATSPEIRFKGFEDSWKIKKLKDISKRAQGNDGRMSLPTLTISAARGWLDQRERFFDNIAGSEQKNYTLLKKGELSYNKGNSKTAKFGVVFELTNFSEALVPRVYHSFKILHNNSASFIEYLFHTKIPDNELSKLISSGARMDGLLNISFSDFIEIPVLIPEPEEQQKIGNYFRKLDTLISQQATQLKKLKQIKAACLEKMFV
ncbi:restriction endonuclease subunit S [Marinospirillum minutulum]|uniref:restriction endonuclease subunit S n=1 Tax=Marinospirillum minutulum TaxID=64974 RepID=UPI000484F4B2|nr:restriction endonuclease subunit S [Marinospirillum minutulum]